MVLRLQPTATRYDDWARLSVGGFRNVNSVPDNGLAGLGNVVDDATKLLLAPAQAKIDSLDYAIKVLLVLSGVAALTGVVNTFRR